MKNFYTILIVISSMLGCSNSSLATNGYFGHGYGTHYKGMAGAGVAIFRSTLGVATNPAGAVFLGKRFDVSLGVFSPPREFVVTGNPSGQPGTFPLAPGTEKSANNFFLVPSMGANWMLNEVSSIGVAMYGNGGMNSEYDTRVFDNPAAPVTSPTGVDMMQMFISTTYSRKLGENHAVGISGIMAMQRFKATGLQAFSGFSNDPTSLTNNGYNYSFGYGLRIGYVGLIAPGLHAGASYQTKANMSKMDDYAGLFAQYGDFDVPATWTAGLAYKATSELTLLFDVQQIQYSGIKSVGNPMNMSTISPVMPDGSNNPNFIPLGANESSGFGWRDMTAYKLGGEFQASEDLTLRAGYSYGKQPIKSTDVMFNILAPGILEHHITVGMTKKLNKNEISFSALYGIPNTVSGPQSF